MKSPSFNELEGDRDMGPSQAADFIRFIRCGRRCGTSAKSWVGYPLVEHRGGWVTHCLARFAERFSSTIVSVAVCRCFCDKLRIQYIKDWTKIWHTLPPLPFHRLYVDGGPETKILEILCSFLHGKNIRLLSMYCDRAQICTCVFCAAEYICTSLLLLSKNHPNDLLMHMQQHFALAPRLLIVFEFVYTPEWSTMRGQGSENAAYWGTVVVLVQVRSRALEWAEWETGVSRRPVE